MNPNFQCTIALLTVTQKFYEISSDAVFLKKLKDQSTK